MLINEFTEVLSNALEGDQSALETWSTYLEKNLLNEEEVKIALEMINSALTLGPNQHGYGLALRADMYREGQGSRVNYKEAIKLYEKSYNKYNNPHGRTCRAHMHRLALGGETDYQAACWHYDIAIKQGNCQAMFYRAVMLERGMGSSQNYEKALSLYTYLAQLGYTKAILRQVHSISAGKGCQANVLAAIALCEQLILNDKTGEAHNILASFFCKYNAQKSIELCEQAIKLGNTDAMINLGPLYLSNGRTSEADFTKVIELCYQSYITVPSDHAFEAIYEIHKLIPKEGDHSKFEKPRKLLWGKFALMLVIHYGLSKEEKFFIAAKNVLSSLPNLIVLTNEEIVHRINTIPNNFKIDATITQTLIDFSVTHYKKAVKECSEENDSEKLLSPIYREIEASLSNRTEEHRNTERLIDLVSICDPEYQLTASKNLRVKVWLHNGESEDAVQFYIDELNDTTPFTSDELHLLATGMLNQLEIFPLVERNRRFELAGELYHQAYSKSKDESSYRYFINLLHNKEFVLKSEKEKYSWTLFDPQNETKEVFKVKNDFLTELKQKKLAISNFTNYIKELNSQTSSFFASKEKIINKTLAKEILSQLKLHVPLLEIVESPQYSDRIHKNHSFSVLISTTLSDKEINKNNCNLGNRASIVF